MHDSRSPLKRIQDWLNKHGWLLFSVGIVTNFCLLLAVVSLSGDYDPDAISVSSTILEIFIVIVAVGGFWMIRGAAINAARGVGVGALHCVADVVREALAEAALGDLRRGPPLPPFTDLRAEARLWAEWASPAERRAYMAATWHRLPERDRLTEHLLSEYDPPPPQGSLRHRRGLIEGRRRC